MMNRCISASCAALIVLTLATHSTAQTTQPAEPTPAPVTWAATVEQFARSTEKGELPAVLALLARDAQLRSFETSDLAAARAMVDSAADWKLLGAHAYEFPPASLAGDIASDVKGSDLVPDADKRKMTPIDENEKARANTTAADWVAQTLASKRNQHVGVALFWHTRLNRPMFVLMKGQATDGAYAVSLAVYGDPMAGRRAQQASAAAEK
jgi:hypothetical protein